MTKIVCLTAGFFGLGICGYLFGAGQAGNGSAGGPYFCYDDQHRRYSIGAALGTGAQRKICVSSGAKWIAEPEK